ncbi:13076_t:CDS:2 [Dentiscutata erythropus]|uniref:13076_t:CDS:1 n=1 Tax=Dentiscutata erythropus TaxID=1348616 RepID=A0A9N8WA41_9GLOM|nr:13076_t:CDS:2 [Dentiscutata erythropus]
MRAIFYVLIISFLIAVVSSFPTGAGTCLSNQTLIESVAKSPMGKLNALGYNFTLNLKNSHYVPGGKAVLTITGKIPFKGLLLYALDIKKNHVGSWTVPKDYKLLNLTDCVGDPNATLTHNSPALKPVGSKFVWKAPTNDVGPISFVGSVVANHVKGFQIVKSQSFAVAGSNFTDPANTAPTNTAITNPYANTIQPSAPTDSPTSNGGDSTTSNSSDPSSPNSASIPTSLSDASSLMSGTSLLAKLSFVAALVILYA